MSDASVKPYERLDATPDGKVYTGTPFPSDTQTWPVPSAPPFAPGTQLKLYPCLGTGYHDYTVGTTHAVCNRCDKVVALNAGSLRPLERGDL